MGKYKFEDIAINCTQKKIPSEEDKAKYIGLEHLDSGSLYVKRWGSTVPLKGEKLIMHKGDVLLGKRNAYLRRAAICPHDGIFSAHGMVLKPRTEVIDERFFPLFIASDYFFDVAVRISVGSLSPTVNWRDLREVEFELPTLEDQRKLADVLWAINDTKESYKELIAATDELVKSQFIEMFGDPVSNTQQRQIVPFKSFMRSIRYGTSTPPKFSEEGEYKFIRATNIKNGHIEEKDMLLISEEEAAKIDKCKLSGGEIIIVRSGANTGDTCVVEEQYAGNYAGYDIIITLDSKRANPVFFNELMNTHYMQTVIKPLTVRSAQPHINTEQVKNLPMIMASLYEQQQFAAFVRQSDKSKFELNQTLDDLNRIYKKIISDNLG